MDDDRLRACHSLGSIRGCAMVGKMIYDVMAKRMNGFPLCYTERQITSPNRMPGHAHHGIYSGVIYGYKQLSGIMSIVQIGVCGSGEGEGSCTRSATGDGDAEAASAVLSGRWSEMSDKRRKGLSGTERTGQGIQPPLSLSAAVS